MNHNILIVDDEEAIRTMLSRHFRFCGYEVHTAEHGEAALAFMATQRVDIVVSDIIMPVMDGVTLLEHIRSDYPMTRVIMITGYVTLENALACMRSQADTVIFKPLNDFEELEEAVKKGIKSIQRWEEKLLALQRQKPAAAH